MRFLPLLLLASCAGRPMEVTRDEFLDGLKLRGISPAKSRAHLLSARERATDLLNLRPGLGPARRVECYSIVARTSLELQGSRNLDRAAIALENGRKFFETHDPHLFWKGDGLAIHLMMGDYFARRGRHLLDSFGGKARGSAEAARVVDDYDLAITEYMLAEDKSRNRSRSFVRQRLVPLLLEKAGILRVESHFTDHVYLTAARRSLNLAQRRAAEETSRPGPDYQRFLELRKKIEDMKTTIDAVLSDH